MRDVARAVEASGSNMEVIKKKRTDEKDSSVVGKFFSRVKWAGEQFNLIPKENTMKSSHYKDGLLVIEETTNADGTYTEVVAFISLPQRWTESGAIQQIIQLCLEGDNIFYEQNRSVEKKSVSKVAHQKTCGGVCANYEARGCGGKWTKIQEGNDIEAVQEWWQKLGALVKQIYETMMKNCSFLLVLNNFIFLSYFLVAITRDAVEVDEMKVFKWAFFSLWSPGEILIS